MELEKFGTAGDIRELLAVRDRIDDLLQRSTRGDVVTPRADLFDLGEALELVVEVAGVPQENLEIALQGRALTVAGIREQSDDNGAIVFCERPSGPFQRTVELPADVDRGGVTAHLSNGLLIVTLPKA